MKNPGASSWVLRWRGNLLYWRGPYSDPKTVLQQFGSSKFSGASSGVWTTPSNQITGLYKPEWRDNEYMRKLEFWYAKSPYENRLAIIAVTPRKERKFEFTYFDYLVYGTNLDIGL
jgi:hypothetical protein